MKAKWKAFAVNETLSSWITGLFAAELFDIINDADSSEIDQVFTDNEVVVWQPFEDWSNVDVAVQIQELAERANTVDNYI